MVFIKNTIENAIAGSIAECASAWEFLEKIKSQFTGSSKDICYPAAETVGDRKIQWRCTWHKGAYPPNEQHGS